MRRAQFRAWRDRNALAQPQAAAALHSALATYRGWEIVGKRPPTAIDALAYYVEKYGAVSSDVIREWLKTLPVEPAPTMTLPDLADLLHVTADALRSDIEAHPDAFPHPLDLPGSDKKPIWRTADVMAWLKARPSRRWW